MKEKILIKSKPYDIKIIITVILSIGIIAFLLSYDTYLVRLLNKLNSVPESGRLNYNSQYKKIDAILSDDGINAFFHFALITILPSIIISVIFYLSLHKTSLTVTNKRIYGFRLFGRQVDLSVDSISSVGITAMLKSVTLSTASGRISFLMIDNRKEIYRALNNLIKKNQKNK